MHGTAAARHSNGSPDNTKKEHSNISPLEALRRLVVRLEVADPNEHMGTFVCKSHFVAEARAVVAQAEGRV